MTMSENKIFASLEREINTDSFFKLSENISIANSELLVPLNNQPINYNLLNDNISDIVNFIKMNKSINMNDSENEIDDSCNTDTSINSETTCTDTSAILSTNGNINCLNSNGNDSVNSTKSAPVAENSKHSSTVDDVELVVVEEKLEIMELDSDSDTDNSVHSLYDELVKNKIVQQPQCLPKIRVRQDLMPKSAYKDKRCGITILLGDDLESYECAVLDVLEFKKQYGQKDVNKLLEKANFRMHLHRAYRRLMKMIKEGNHSDDQLKEYFLENIDKVLSNFEIFIENKKKNTDFLYKEVEIVKELSAELTLAKEINNCKLKIKDKIEDTKVKGWCGYCKQQATFLCCSSATYCSTNCQELDWSAHQTVCNQLNMNMTTPKLRANPLIRELLKKNKSHLKPGAFINENPSSETLCDNFKVRAS